MHPSVCLTSFYTWVTVCDTIWAVIHPMILSLIGLQSLSHTLFNLIGFSKLIWSYNPHPVLESKDVMTLGRSIISFFIHKYFWWMYYCIGEYNIVLYWEPLCLQITGHQIPWDSGEMHLGLSGRNMELKIKCKMKNYEHLKYK